MSCPGVIVSWDWTKLCIAVDRAKRSKCFMGVNPRDYPAGLREFNRFKTWDCFLTQSFILGFKPLHEFIDVLFIYSQDARVNTLEWFFIP